MSAGCPFWLQKTLSHRTKKLSQRCFCGRIVSEVHNNGVKLCRVIEAHKWVYRATHGAGFAAKMLGEFRLKNVRRMFMRRKWTAVMMAVVFVLVMVCGGCGSEEKSDSSTKSDSGSHLSAVPEGASDADAYDDTTADGEIGEVKNDLYSETADMEAMDISEDATSASFAKGGEGDATVERPAEQEIMPEAEAGMLTAGEWCDNDNWGFFKNLFTDGNDWSTYRDGWNMDFTNRIAVTVTYKGKALRDAKVELNDKEGNVIWQAVSDYAGKAYVFYNVANDNEKPESITVSKATYRTTKKLEGGDPISVKDDKAADNQQQKEAVYPQEEITIDLEGKSDHDLLLRTDVPATELDLMYVVDTTGSMSDELTYLQMELKDVVQKVQKNNKDLNIRISTNFYRDKGDAYEVNSHPFTKDLDEAVKWINNESTDGGGDYPEAVDKALEDALNNHEWKEDAVKLAFLVLDAPPHNGNAVEKRLLATIKGMAEKGIRVIPVASSGVDKESEFICRKFAVATGGTYTFLTDDSGIGESHIEPTIGSYDVKKLNDLMVEITQRYL